MPIKKDYINNVYQDHSRYGTSISDSSKWIGEKMECFNQESNSNYVAPIQYDPKLGAYYNERSNWIGGKTEGLSQAMSNYIFQPVNFR